MNIALRVIIDLFIVGGCFFAFAGAVGIVRMPDTFSRMQSSTNITTLGVLLTLIGALLYCIFVMHSWGSAAKVVVIGVLTVLANPVGGHAIARAAYRIGIRPRARAGHRRPGRPGGLCGAGDGGGRGRRRAPAVEKEGEQA